MNLALDSTLLPAIEGPQQESLMMLKDNSILNNGSSLIDNKSSQSPPRTFRELSVLWNDSFYQNLPFSNRSLVLVLPDSIRPKYYLQDKSKVIKSREARFAREMKKYEFLSQKAAEEVRKQSGRSSINIPDSTTGVKSRYEREVESRILGPYRDNPQLLEALIDRVKHKTNKKNISKRAESSTLSMCQSPENVAVEVDHPQQSDDDNDSDGEEDIFDNAVPELIGKNESASPYRKRISSLHVGEQRGEIISTLLQLQDEMDKRRASVYRKEKFPVKETWLTFLEHERRLRVFFRLVTEARKLKEENLKHWKAAIVIQRRWRKSGYANDFVSTVKKYLESQGRNQGRQALYLRQQALSIITTFLGDSNAGIKACIRSYFRKVRFCQRYYRKHLKINRNRVIFLDVIADRAMTIIHFFMTTMLTGRPLDQIEPSILEKLKQKNDPLVITDLFSQKFMTQLNRLGKTTCSMVVKAIKRDAVTGKWGIESRVKYKVLNRLLTYKRRQHIQNIKRLESKKYEILPVDENDVRAFIQYGYDPLIDRVKRLAYVLESEKDDTKETNKGGKMTLGSLLKGSTSVAYSASGPLPMLNLLRSLTANDLLNACIELASKQVDYNNRKKKARDFTQYQSSRTVSKVKLMKKMSTIDATGIDDLLLFSENQERNLDDEDAEDEENDKVKPIPIPPAAPPPSFSSAKGRVMRKSSTITKS